MLVAHQVAEVGRCANRNFETLGRQRLNHLGLANRDAQRIVQARVIASLLDATPGGLLPAPGVLRFASRFLAFRHIPARLFGYGIRRERVQFGPRA